MDQSAHPGQRLQPVAPTENQPMTAERRREILGQSSPIPPHLRMTEARRKELMGVHYLPPEKRK